MTPAEQRLIDRYQSTGRVVSVRKKRDGRVYVSLNGIEMPAYEALEKIRAFFKREPNPGARRSAKWDRCVKDVRRSGSAVNAYAVCTQALGSAGLRHSPRAGNPLPRSGQVELVAVWKDRQGREHTLFKRFPTLEEARTKARRFVIAITRATGHSPKTHIVRRVPFNP